MGHAGRFIKEKGYEQGNHGHAPETRGTGFGFTRMPRLPGAWAFCVGGIAHRELNIDSAPAYRYGRLPLLKGLSSVKIRKFTVALAVSALAVAGLSTPTASAYDVKVSGDTCTLSESYDGESEEWSAHFEELNTQFLPALKAQLPGTSDAFEILSDVDASEEAKDEALQIIFKVIGEVGFTELEAAYFTSVVLLLRNASTIEVPDIDDSTEVQPELESGEFTKAEAAEMLPELKEMRALIAKNQIKLGTGEIMTSSAPALPIMAPVKTAYLDVFDLQIEVYEACVAGTGGTFILDTDDTGDNPAEGGSSAPSFGSSR